MISTAENLKIKGLAEPERPIEKSVKRLASPPRGQNLSTGSTPIALFSSSSPSAKRKRCDQFAHCTTYTNSRDKDDKLNSTPLADLHRDASSGTSQVVLLPTADSAVAATDLTPQQSYVSHHASLATSDGVLYSVAGTAIYVGTSTGNATPRGELIREVYSATENYTNNSEDTVAGPSGVQTPHQNDSTMVCPEFEMRNVELIVCLYLKQSIKLEPSVSLPAEGWDGSNHSYEDGGTGSDGGGGGVSTPSGGALGTSNDPLSLTLPLHSEITETPLHESTRVS